MVTALAPVEDPEQAIAPAAPELDADDRRALVERNEKLALWWVSRYFHRATQSGIDRDDLEQAARLGLCEAAARYRPGAGKFSAFAALHIRGEILRLFGQQKRFPRAVDPRLLRVSEEEHDRARDSADHSEQAPRPSRVFLDVGRHEDDRLDRLRAALAALPEFDVGVVADHCGLGGGEPQRRRDIAFRLGKGVGTVRRAIDASLAAIRADIEAAERDESRENA